MRSAEDILARARLTSLIGTLASGTSVALLRPELQRHALGIHLSARENAWLWHDEAIEASERGRLEAMRALAWALRLVDELGAPDLEVYGPIQDVLDDASLPEPTPRDAEAIRAMLDASAPEAWRHRALRWALGDDADW